MIHMLGWGFHVKSDEGSLVFEIKGDPARMKARQEAIDAFFEFRKKARAAGMTPGCILRDLVLAGMKTRHSTAARAPQEKCE